MIVEIYLFLFAIGFIFLAKGVLTIDPTKIPLLILTGIIFFFLALQSMDIDYRTCTNHVDWINVTSNENQTQLTNNISCHDEKIRSTPLSYLNWVVGISAMLYALFSGLFFMREQGQSPKI